MENRRRLIMLVSIISIILLGVIAIFLWSNNPYVAFQRKFGFKLPSSTKIVQCDYDIGGENNLYAKISFAETDYSYIESNMLDFYNNNRNSEEIAEDNPMFRFNRSTPWWDVTEDNTVFAYHTFMSGKHAKTREVFTFITKDSAGQYYLYVAH